MTAISRRIVHSKKGNQKQNKHLKPGWLLAFQNKVHTHEKVEKNAIY